MSLCAFCGLSLTGDATLCEGHGAEYRSTCDGSTWAASNRLQCDFFHRGRLTGRDPETVEEFLERVDWFGSWRDSA